MTCSSHLVNMKRKSILELVCGDGSVFLLIKAKKNRTNGNVAIENLKKKRKRKKQKIIKKN